MKSIDPVTEETVRRFLDLIRKRYDVAVILRGEHQRRLPVKLDMVDSTHDVMLDTGVHVSPYPIWADEWEYPENCSNPELLENIRREGIRL